MQKENNPNTSKEGRSKVESIVRFWASFFLKVAGVTIEKKELKYEEVYKKYLGSDYKIDLNDQDYSLIISNHIGFYEVVFNMVKYVPGFIAKKEIEDYYFIGPIAQGLNCLFCKRESAEARQQIFVELEKRQKEFSEKKTLAPLVLFPEGTTTSGRNILKFKRGAFYAILPVKPLIVQIDQSAPLHLAVGSSDIVLNFFRSLCFFSHKLYYVELPVIRPTNYMFKHYAYLGEEKWEVYSEVVRKICCEIGGFEPSDKNLRDSKYYNKIMAKGVYPLPEEKKEQ